jgi:hypothetical protein
MLLEPLAAAVTALSGEAAASTCHLEEGRALHCGSAVQPLPQRESHLDSEVPTWFLLSARVMLLFIRVRTVCKDCALTPLAVQFTSASITRIVIIIMLHQAIASTPSACPAQQQPGLQPYAQA